MHSPMFDKIKRWYDSGVYTKAMVRKLWQKGQITEAEYIEITGGDS